MVAENDGQFDGGSEAVESGDSGRDAFEALRASGAFDEVLAKADAGEVQLTGEGGFLQEMVKAVHGESDEEPYDPPRKLPHALTYT